MVRTNRCTVYLFLIAFMYCMVVAAPAFTQEFCASILVNGFFDKFVVIIEGDDAPSDFFTILSAVDSCGLQYGIVDDVDWLTAVPSSGELSAGSSVNIEIVYASADLPPGLHEATMTIISNDPLSPVTSISITLDVEPAVLPGDVNCDGSVTPGDAQAAFDAFLGISTPACIDNGDVCPVGGDGNVTPGDAQGIFNMFLGLPIPCG